MEGSFRAGMALHCPFVSGSSEEIPFHPGNEQSDIRWPLRDSCHRNRGQIKVEEDQHLLQPKHGSVSTESEISIVFLCTGFWNSSKGPFISSEIPLGSLDLGWSLEREQSLSVWNGSTNSKTLDNQKTNPREYQIVWTHTKETTWIQDLVSPNHQ